MSLDTELNLFKVNSLEQNTAINLIKLRFPDGQYLFICDSYDFTYLGDNYKYLDFSISGDLMTQTDEKSRPSIDLANPDGMLSKLAISGKLEGSVITRYQIEARYGETMTATVVRSDVWKVYQIPMISTKLTLQLRRLGDNLSQKFPPRGYYPPEFYHVNV